MGGRADYQERKQKRIDRYRKLSGKSRQQAEAKFNSPANRTLMSTPGQPILLGHHSERYHRNLIKRANNDIKKSIELSDKGDYYERRANNVENSNVIYNDDPEAIPKLKDKLERLENEREEIKTREHESWELTNIGANIREVKMRIERLEELEKTEFPEICFSGGKAIHNKDINRIQILFDGGKPDDEVIKDLRHNGFHWSRSEGAWQRQFNKKTIWKTKDFIERYEKNYKEKEGEEERE